MDAEDLLLREFLGIRTAEQTAGAAQVDPLAPARRRHLGQLLWRPADLSTTIEAYVALRLAGDSPDDEHMARARALHLRVGGIEAQPRLYAHLARDVQPLALGRAAGDAAGNDLRARHLPLNIYDFACWARQTVVALTVVSAHRPSHRLTFTSTS